jgi:hypothetical protein
MTNFYAKKVKDLMALICQILNLRKKLKKSSIFLQHVPAGSQNAKKGFLKCKSGL